jgi:hypothetical protein
MRKRLSSRAEPRHSPCRGAVTLARYRPTWRWTRPHNQLLADGRSASPAELSGGKTEPTHPSGAGGTGLIDF